jgi:hypothetical protein
MRASLVTVAPPTRMLVALLADAGIALSLAAPVCCFGRRWR